MLHKEHASTSERIVIYIIHFDSPYWHARHYVGYCADGRLQERLERHRMGRGSRLMAAIELAGIGWTVALTHPGDRSFERRLKRAHHTDRFCPICLLEASRAGIPADRARAFARSVLSA